MRQALLRYSYRYGLSLTLLLTVMFIVATSLWERSYIGEMKESSASIFNDRLMPATMLFRLSDEVHEKRFVVEDYLHGERRADVTEIYYKLGQLDSSIGELITRIERTYLVADESEHLVALRARLDEYNRLEKALLRASAAGKAVTYDAELRQAFGKVRTELSGLTDIQANVGKQLSEEAVEAAAGASSVTHLQVAVAFVLGLISAALAIGLQVVNLKTAAPSGSSDLH